MHVNTSPLPAPSADATMSPARGWFAFTRQPWFAYVMLLLLQLKVVWRMWDYRDLTSGDTSAYYLLAWDWHKDLTVNLAWSPLYTAFYGSMHFLTADAATATLLHRLIIIFLSSLLVLALFRRLMTPGIAWLTAAWWTILPINFNTLYEVHLFTLLPILMVFLVIQYRASPWARGVALASLLATSVLVRNELSVAFGLLALICTAWEFARWKRADLATKPRLSKTISAYLIPLLLTCSIVSAFYARSVYKFPLLWTSVMHTKHVLNMAQVFTFGYQQRNPEWKGDPWVGYQDLMCHQFGKETPSLGEMYKANPGATMDHILWNFRLVPNGLQVSLFNSAWGTDNPDYAPIETQSTLALNLSLLTLAVWASGIILVMCAPRYWWRQLFRPRLLTLLAMLCIALVSIPVIATQRPRPSYLFGLSVVLMAMTGIWVSVIVERLTFLKKLSALIPAVMIGFCLLVPSYYADATKQKPRLLHQAVDRLKPFRFLLAKPDPSASAFKCDIVPKQFDASKARFLKGEFAYEVCSYLGRGYCESFDYRLLAKRSVNQTLVSFLDQHGITLFYLDERLLTALADADDGADPFLGEAGNAEWQWIGGQNIPGDRWKLFRRSVPEVRLGSGWHGLEDTPEGKPFRWVENDAELIVTPHEIAKTLLLDIEPGFGLAGGPGEFTVADKSGQIFLTQTVGLKGRQLLRVPLPANAPPPLQVRLHVTNGGTPIPTDPRIMNFRVFQVGLSAAHANQQAK